MFQSRTQALLSFPNGQENKTLEDDPANVITEIHETTKIHDKTDPASRNVFYWGDIGSTIFIKDLRDAYESIVFWRKTGAAGKRYINHITQLFYEWVNDSPLKDIALMAIHVMPAILLQKPSKNSKSVDHPKSVRKTIENIGGWEHYGTCIRRSNKSEQFKICSI